MHMAARAHANEMLMIFRWKFEFDYFRKTTIVTGEKLWLNQGSNPGPFACRANHWATKPTGHLTRNFLP